MPTVPVIANSDRIIDATATAAQDTFAIIWPVIADTELLAVNDLVVLVDGAAVDPAAFSFQGNAITGLNGIWNGGDVVLDNPLAGGERVIIYSARDPRRTGNYLEGKSLPFTELDKLMDDFAIQLRDLELLAKRSLTVSVADYLDGADTEGLATQLLNAVAEVEGAAAQIANLISGVAPTVVKSATTAAQPGAPTLGDAYIVPSGGWGGLHAQSIAVYTGVWSYLPAADGQQMWVQDTNTRWKYNSANSAWKKLRSKKVYVSDFVTLAAASAMAAAATAELVFDEDVTLTANYSFPSSIKSVAREGGKIVLGVYDLTFNNQNIRADHGQFFDSSSTGKVKGTINAENIVVDWWGATSASIADPASTNAGNNCLNYIEQSGRKNATMLCPAVVYYLSGPWVKPSSFYCPTIKGDNSILLYNSNGTAGAIQLNGLSGGNSLGRITGFYFKGNATSWAIEVIDQCFVEIDHCDFKDNAIGIVVHGKNPGGFPEFVTWHHCDFDYDCITCWWFKLTSGTNSFHGSGPAGNVTLHNKVGNLQPFYKLDPAAIVYNAPLSYQAWSNESIVHGTLGLNSYLLTYGDISGEAFAGVPTLSSGSPRHSIHAGHAMCWGNGLALGVTRLADQFNTNADGVLRVSYKMVSVSLALPEDGGAVTLYPSGGIDNAMADVMIEGVGYLYKYTLKLSATGVLPPSYTGVTNEHSVNVAGYGAPVFAWDGKALSITNANYPAATLTAYINAVYMGQAIYGKYN